jgi:GMP synthase (glutamine-hydrolysing)
LILVLDFGSQFTQLIARRIRELGVFTQIRPCTVNPSEVDLSAVRAVILSGGPSSVTDSDAPRFDKVWLDLDLPILGICYGMQLLAHHYGGKLGQGSAREYGPSTIEIQEQDGLFAGMGSDPLQVWMSHGDHVDALPPHFVSTASSSGAPFAAMRHTSRPMCAIQFHPEVVHTPRGKEILSNFVFRVAGCVQDWKPGDFLEHSVKMVNDSIGADGKAICALSGGVDSTVAAVIVSKAIGKRLHCIFVDNGLLRKNEAQQVMERFKELDLQVEMVDASKEFLTALKGVTDPEKKRKIIGGLFIDVFASAAERIQGVTHLVQGTLYPDVIESVSVRGGPSATIKTHHNVGGLPERLPFALVEPLRELFKDEVRALGRTIGIPELFLARQPFPGPGLAVRVLGEVTEPRLAALREADNIFLEEVRAAGLYSKMWQSFAVLLPVQSVGVMGDGRTYEQTVALRAVTSEDGMTADWVYLPEALLRRVSNRVVNETKGINRVVMDISSKPPSTIEWE